MATDTSWQPWEQEDAEKLGAQQVAEYQKQIRAAFDKLTPEQRRNVIHWGNPDGLEQRHVDAFGEDAARTLAQVRDLNQAVYTLNPDGTSTVPWGGVGMDDLRDMRGALAGRAQLVRQVMNDQFGDIRNGLGNYVREGAYPLHLPPQLGNVSPAAYVNTQRTGAIADEWARLEDQYPGIASRLNGIVTGRSNSEAWHELIGRLAGGGYGETEYNIGTPAMSSVLRNPLLARQYGPDEGSIVKNYEDLMNSRFFATSPEAGYESLQHAIAAHEFGHAAQYSMEDFVRGIKQMNGSTPATDAYDKLVNSLAGRNVSHISNYAENARQTALNSMVDPESTPALQAASREPFAELFSVARSPAAFRYAQGDRSAFMDMVGPQRTGAEAEKLADNLSQFNNMEKTLRNEGYNEIGSALPGTIGSIAAPVALGLLAAKTHGTARKVLAGAAGGAGLGAVLGPEGAVAGGTIGGGLALAKQLL